MSPSVPSTGGTAGGASAGAGGLAVVVLAAGSGTRVGAGVNKVLLEVGGEPVVSRSVRTAVEAPGAAVVVVVCRAGDEEPLADALAPALARAEERGVEVRMTTGGATRHDSEAAALAALADHDGIDVVAMHDAARPLADAGLYAAVVAAAREHGGAVPAARLTHLVQRAGGPVPGLGGPGARTVGVQTPQAFRVDVLRAAHAWASETGFAGTDTAACVAAWAHAVVGDAAPRIVVVDAPASNLKVTWPEDLRAATSLLTAR